MEIQQFPSNWQIQPNEVADLASVIGIDDDNQPAPENVPDGEGAGTQVEQMYGPWGHPGICYRRQLDVVNRNARLTHFTAPGIQPTKLQLWELMLPTQFVKEVIISRGER